MLTRVAGIITAVAICAVAVGGFARSTNAATLNGHTGIHFEDALVLLGTDDCEYHCRTCPGGGESRDGENRHDIVVRFEGNKYKSSHLENCNPGTCKAHECAGGGGVELLGGAVAVGSEVFAYRDLSPAQLLLKYPERAQFDEERGVLFLTCSAGQIVASISLTEAELGELYAPATSH